MHRTAIATFGLNALNSKMVREYAMYVRPASWLKVGVGVHDGDSNLCLFEGSE